MGNILKFLIIPVLGILTLSSCAKDNFQLSDNQCTPLSEILDFTLAQPKERLEIDGKGITQWIVSEVKEKVWVASTYIYMKIAFNIDFRFTVAMMMTLSIIFFAASVLLGIIQANAYNMLMFIIKLVVIYQLSINYIYFQMYVIQTFEAIVQDATMFATFTFSDYIDAGSFVNGALGAWADPAKMLGVVFGTTLTDLIGLDNITNKLDIFYAVDNNLSKMFNFNFVKLIMATGGFGSTGILYAIMLFAVLIMYLFAIIACLKVYLMSYIGRYVLYGLGPIFISLALFNQTRSLFDGWLQQLINFTLQPVFLFIFFGMFHSIISGLFQQMKMELSTQASKITILCDTTVTPGCTCPPDGCICPPGVTSCTPSNTIIGTMPKSVSGASMCIKPEKFEGDNFWWYRICYDGYCPSGDLSPQIPIDIWMILMTLVMCYILLSMCTWVTQVASQISNGMITLSDVRIAGYDRLKTQVSSQVQGGFSKLKNSLTSGTTKRPGGGG